VSAALARRGWETFTVDKDPAHKADLVTDVRKLDLERLGRDGNFDAIFAGVDCRTMTRLAHRGPAPARDKEGKALTAKAREADEVNQTTMAIYDHFKRLNPDLMIVIENPVGDITKQDCFKRLACFRCDQCSYGRPQRKETVLLTDADLNDMRTCQCEGAHAQVLKQDKEERSLYPPELTETIAANIDRIYRDRATVKDATERGRRETQPKTSRKSVKLHDAVLAEEARREQVEKAKLEEAARVNRGNYLKIITDTEVDKGKTVVKHGSRPVQEGPRRSLRHLVIMVEVDTGKWSEEVTWLVEDEVADKPLSSNDKQVRRMPQTPKQALADQKQTGVKWDTAMKAELDQFVAMESFQDVLRSDVPRTQRLLKTKWVFTIKPDGTPKARLVIQGQHQRYGLDYFETASPTVDLGAVKALVVWSLAQGREMFQYDIKNAFLQSKIDVEMYLEIPEGYTSVHGKAGAWKVMSSIYGCKQAPLLWHLHLRKVLRDRGYTPFKGDSCLYYKREGDIDIVCAVYVDDFAVSVLNEASRKQFEKDISVFEFKALGKVKRLLSIEHVWDNANKRVFLHQQEYTDKIVAEWLGPKGREYNVPCSKGFSFTSETGAYQGLEMNNRANVTKAQKVIGAVRWLERNTRPDLAFVLHECAKYMSNPSAAVMEQLDQVLGYLKFTRTHGLVYDARGVSSTTGHALPIKGFADSSWANATDMNYKSVGGYTLTIGHNLIGHSCKLSKTVCTSSAHAEIASACELFKSQLWLGKVVDDLMPLEDSEAVGRYTIYEDASAAIAWATAPNVTSKSKHFSVKYYFVKEAVDDKILNLDKVSTHDQIADIFTKGLDRLTFEKHRTSMGVVSIATYNLGGDKCRAVMGWNPVQ
jgi:hypothetical protein